MAARLGWADAVGGAPSYVGRALRQMASVMLSGATTARPLGATSGVRAGTPSTIVSATSTTWTVTPFAGVIDLEAAAIAGPYQFAFDTNQTGAMTAAGGSARVDLIWVRVNDGAEGDGTVVAPFVEVGYTANTTTPPARAFAIAQINVPATGGGSPTTTWVAPYTVAAGGILPVSASTYPGSPFVGQHVDDANAGLLRWTGSRWARNGATVIYPGSVPSAGASLLSSGVVLFAGATEVTLDGIFSQLAAVGAEDCDIILKVTTGAAVIITANYRAGGTDYAGTTHDVQQTYSSGNSAAGSSQSVNQTSMQLTSGGGLQNYLTARCFGPMLSGNKLIKSTFDSYRSNTGVHYDGTTSTAVKNGAAFDGIRLSFGGVAASGSVYAVPVGIGR